MAAIMARAFIWPVMLPLVASWLRVASSQSRVEDPVATDVQLAQRVGLLLDELLLDGGSVVEHVGADTGFGFGVGGGVRVEACGFSGLTVGHGAREDQRGKGHFLIGDGVGDFIFGHRESSFLGWVQA